MVERPDEHNIQEKILTATKKHYKLKMEPAIYITPSELQIPLEIYRTFSVP
jgi:hypothetical protein